MPVHAALSALSQMLIGLAWEDGEVTSDELNIVKDVIFRLPEIDEEGWDALNIYWITPIGDHERDLLQQQLMATLEDANAREAVKEALVHLVTADGRVTSEETALLKEINRLVDRRDPNLASRLSVLLQHALPRREGALQATPNREDYMDDFLHNTVLQHLKEQYGDDISSQMDLSEEELHKLGLTGALMARVAYADADVDSREIDAMLDVLQRVWSLPEEYATVIVDVAVDAGRQRMDFWRLTREFFEMTSDAERLDFIEVLFEIARAHEGIQLNEVEIITQISDALKIEAETFDYTKTQAMDV